MPDSITLEKLFEWILWLSSVIAAAASATVFFNKMPFVKTIKQVNNNTKDIIALRENINSVREQLEKNNEMTILVCRGVVCLLESQRTGNSLVDMRQAELDIRNYIETKTINYS